MENKMEKTGYNKVSDTTRLMSLPKIFRGRDLLDLGIKSNVVHVYLSRWKKKSLIKTLGKRSDVFFNALCHSNEPWIEDAILDLFPGAIQVGVEPLHRGGWTTQIPKIEVAVPVKNEYHSIHAKFYCYSGRWFKAASKGIAYPQITPIPSLRPPWALADMWLSRDKDACKPDPDDIEFNDIDLLLVDSNHNPAQDFYDAVMALAPVHLGIDKAKEIVLSDSSDFYTVYMDFRDQIRKICG